MADETRIEIGVEGIDEAADKVKSLDETAKKVQEAVKSRERAAREATTRELTGSQKFGDAALAGRISGSLQRFSSLSSVQGIARGFGNPTQSLSGSGVGSDLAKEVGGGALTVAGGALGGPVGAAIAQAMTAPLNAFIDRFFAKQEQVEQEAGSAVRGRVRQFAERGINVNNDEIARTLEMERARSRRVYDAMEQVARVQDETSGTLEGMIANLGRRTYDAIVG